MLRLLPPLLVFVACTASAQGIAMAGTKPVALAQPQPVRLSAEAEGRRTLSTAFVRMGPDGQLTIELRGGTVLILRDVVVGPEAYCGTDVSGRSGKARYCGKYAEIVAARPGGRPTPGPMTTMAPHPPAPAPVTRR